MSQQLTRTTKVTLLICLLVGCQAAPPEIQLNDQQQMDLNAIFTRAALQAMEIGTTTGKLKKAKVVEILSESDGEVQGVLTESDWQQYDRSGRDYVAARIQSLVSGRRDLSAAEVAELMGGSGGARMPAIGGHH